MGVRGVVAGVLTLGLIGVAVAAIATAQPGLCDIIVPAASVEFLGTATVVARAHRAAATSGAIPGAW